MIVINSKHNRIQASADKIKIVLARIHPGFDIFTSRLYITSGDPISHTKNSYRVIAYIINNHLVYIYYVGARFRSSIGMAYFGSIDLIDDINNI